MPADPPAPLPVPQRIDATFRNGSLTVVGILFGFSLGFIVQWSTDPEPWTVLDIVTSLLFLVGLGQQLRCVFELLQVNSLEIPVYERAKGRFMIGLLFIAAGVLLVVAGNVVDTGFHLLWTHPQQH